MRDTIRIGMIGAGANSRAKHLPELQKIDGVQLSGICNRSAESTEHIKQQFDFAKSYPQWQEVIDDPEIDAIVIGTWPQFHCEITCAALEAGKHVLTEARMARNLPEARTMAACAQQHPDLIAQIVPSPFGLVYGEYLSKIIDDGFIGTLRELVVLGANDAFWDFSQFLHPRQDREASGFNTLTMGILHETARRWTPKPTQVFAQSQIFENRRIDQNTGDHVNVEIPDSLQIVTKIGENARGLYHFSGVTLFGPGLQIHLYGSEGTIKIEFGNQFPDEEQVYLGRAGDTELKKLELPDEKKGRWQVEQDFISAIYGEIPVTLNDFATGLDYMEFTEAVHISTNETRPVALPLP